MRLRSFQPAERYVWLVSSGLFSAYGVSLVSRASRERRVEEFREFVGRRIFLFVFSIGVAVLPAQLINILPFGVEPGAQGYPLGVTWLLFSAGYVFWFILRSWVRAA